MRFRPGRPLGALCAVILLLFPAGSARALTDEEIFRSFRFDFTNPGARSLGMGGASVAAVIDSTAAEANPAGLHYVDEAEFFIELRTVDTTDEVFTSNFGSLAVDLTTGERNLPYLALTSAADTETRTDVSFLSFAWPFHLGRSGTRLTVAGSRHVTLSQDRSLPAGGAGTAARFSFDTFPNTVNGNTIEAYSVNTPVTGDSSLEIIDWNVGASLAVHSDFSIGATITYATLDATMDTLTQVEDPAQLFVDPTHPRLPAQSSVDLYTTSINDTDNDMTFSIGIHWHPDSLYATGFSPWRFGAVFRQGARFEVTETTTLNQVPDETFSNTIVVPDRFGLGVSYRTKRHWIVTADFERVEYSDLMDGFQSGVNYLTSGRVAGDAFPIDPNQQVQFTIDDGTIYRIGVEYIHQIGGLPAGVVPVSLHSGRHLSIWGGYYRTPDDIIRMTQFNSTDPDVNAVYLDAFRGGEAVDHLTAGIGYSTGRHRFQMAAETSDEGHQLAGSYVLTFGRSGR